MIMKLTFLNVIAFFLFWTLSVVALPAETDHLPGVAQFDNSNYTSDAIPLEDGNELGFTPIEDTPDAQVVNTLAHGINCKGNLNCGFYCRGPNIATFRRYLNRIPNRIIYKSGAQVVCIKCRAKRQTSICLFPQRLKSGELISALTIKEKVKGLEQHGCIKCGSNPVHGNDGANGEVTLNIVSNGCGTGICPYAD